MYSVLGAGVLVKRLFLLSRKISFKRVTGCSCSYKVMRQALDNNGTYSKPYARIALTKKPNNRTGVRLWLSVGAAAKFGLKDKEKVDLFWEKYNKVWKRSVLILKRGGTQRSLSSMGQAKASYFVQMKMLVKQCEIPLIPHPLPILDYINNEIWIDFSGERETEVAQYKLWEKRYGKAKRHTFDFGDSRLDVRSNTVFIDQCKVMGEKDGGSLAALTLRLLATHMEDDHPQLWYQLINSLGEG